MKKALFKAIFVVLALTILMLPAKSQATSANFYAGTTFVSEGSGNYCFIIRFQAAGFSLQESDALYALLAGYATDSNVADRISHVLPSQNLRNGITGEALWDAFIRKGTGLCTFSGKPADQILFTSLYKCFYQGADHTCIRFYVHTGALNLSSLGIPYNMVAGLGALVVAEPIWDAVTAEILKNPPQLPLTINTIGQQIKETLNTSRKAKSVSPTKK